METKWPSLFKKKKKIDLNRKILGTASPVCPWKCIVQYSKGLKSTKPLFVVWTDCSILGCVMGVLVRQLCEDLFKNFGKGKWTMAVCADSK